MPARSRLRRFAALAIGLAVTAAITVPPAAAGKHRPPVRFATFDARMVRVAFGALAAELAVPGSTQPDVIAKIIQINRPDVLLLNGIDIHPADPDLTPRLFQSNYLALGSTPIVYPYRYVPPCNAGEPSGFDFDNDGVANGPGDAYGFGLFPGQGCMVLFSMFPIDVPNVRTFNNLRWEDVPNARMPPGWFTVTEKKDFRLSSTAHADVPIRIGLPQKRPVHVLISNPTSRLIPPLNVTVPRNDDEVEFWDDYISYPPGLASYIADDNQTHGGLTGNRKFVIMGNLNAAVPQPAVPGPAPPIARLLAEPRINNTVAPQSLGAVQQAFIQGGANLPFLKDHRFDTADLADCGSCTGNLRLDYVLPHKNLKIVAAEVFWPLLADPFFPYVGVFPFPGSPHRLVWVDVTHWW